MVGGGSGRAAAQPRLDPIGHASRANAAPLRSMYNRPIKPMQPAGKAGRLHRCGEYIFPLRCRLFLVMAFFLAYIQSGGSACGRRRSLLPLEDAERPTPLQRPAGFGHVGGPKLRARSDCDAGAKGELAVSLSRSAHHHLRGDCAHLACYHGGCCRQATIQTRGTRTGQSAVGCSALFQLSSSHPASASRRVSL
jgi:hypothetical protein